MSDTPSVRVVRFWTDYQPQPDGSIKSIEKAELAPRGFGKYTSTPWRIVDLMRDTSGLWDIVRPSYEAWKQGQEAPWTAPRSLHGRASRRSRRKS